MGFTHAYFPVYAFDEYSPAAVGRLLAKAMVIWQSPLHEGLVSSRADITRYGNCVPMGTAISGCAIWVRAALDGDFSSFKKKILALDLEYADDSVRFPTLRGDTLSFGWQGPFLRNEEEQPLSGFEHYENPYVVSEYPSRQMEIQYGDIGSCVLNLESARPIAILPYISPPDMS